MHMYIDSDQKPITYPFASGFRLFDFIVWLPKFCDNRKIGTNQVKSYVHQFVFPPPPIRHHKNAPSPPLNRRLIKHRRTCRRCYKRQPCCETFLMSKVFQMRNLDLRR